MIKHKTTTVLVDSVVDAVRFYTQQMFFDIIELRVSGRDRARLGYAHLRKGKCTIVFREPSIDESPEFSQIKHCLGRGVVLRIEVASNIERWYERCCTKDVKILKVLQSGIDGLFFVCKDPFGLRLMFYQETPQEKIVVQDIAQQVYGTTSVAHDMLVEVLVQKLHGYGVPRRAAKKYGRRALRALS